MKRFVLVGVMFLSLFSAGCWAQPEANTAYVQTVWGKPTKVVRPPGIWTITTLGDEYHTVNLALTTGEFTIRASSSDNAGFTWVLKYSYQVLDEDAAIMSHVSTYGVNPEARKKSLDEVVFSYISDVVKEQANKYSAYKLLESSDLVQAEALKVLQPRLKEKCWIKLETLSPYGKPDFTDDNIETAASRVVANQKEVEAERAKLEAVKLSQERQEIQGRILQNPALRELEMLNMQLKIETVRAEGVRGHNGPLTIVYGADSRVLVNSGQQ